jgi:hypothetical protein
MEQTKTCDFTLQAVVFLSPTAQFFHYAIAIALSTSDDTVYSFARQELLRVSNP